MNICNETSVIVLNPIKIFIVKHITFENTNVFFTDKKVADRYIKEVIPIKYPNENLYDWKIIEITEGEEFEADIDIWN